MNCVECQENLVADLDGILDPGNAAEFENHLIGCPACQTEQLKMTELHQRLVTHGETASRVALGPAVMGRIRRQQAEAPSAVTPLSRWLRWALGCGAATVTIVLAVLLLSPSTTANAAEVMARGVKAAMRLTSVHLQCRMRSAPAANFVHLGPQAEFTSLELWKEWEGQGRWRIEKPGRVVVMDGQSTVHFLRPFNSVTRVPPVPGMMVPTAQAFSVGGEMFPERWAPFDTGWLHAIADIERALETELLGAHAKGWKMTVTRERTPAGGAQAVVAIEAASGLPQGDYLHNKLFRTADTRRVYRFDEETGRLQGVEVFLHEPTGEVLIFEVTRIAYNEVFAPDVFRLELPPDIVEQGMQRMLAGDDARYAGLTVEQAARQFFEACGREDWTEVSAFWPTPLERRFKDVFGGLKIVSIGESFTSVAHPGRFVPYEIEFRLGERKSFNLVLKRDNTTGRWFVDGGL